MNMEFIDKAIEDNSAIDGNQYEIELICLEKIPLLNLQNLMISTIDLSATQVIIPSVENIAKDKEDKEIVRKYPEIVFYLKVPSKIDHTQLESISLANAIIPDFHLLASKCKLIENENVIEEVNGIKFFTKIVFDLNLITPETLMKLNEKENENL